MWGSKQLDAGIEARSSVDRQAPGLERQRRSEFQETLKTSARMWTPKWRCQPKFGRTQFNICRPSRLLRMADTKQFGRTTLQNGQTQSTLGRTLVSSVPTRACLWDFQGPPLARCIVSRNHPQAPSDPDKSRLGRGFRGRATRRWDGPLQQVWRSGARWQAQALDRVVWNEAEEELLRRATRRMTCRRAPPGRFMIEATPD